VTLDGRLFHTREAATGNARSPMVEWRVGGTSVDADADLNKPRCKNQARQLHFNTRVINIWNSLPANSTDFSSFCKFCSSV